MCAQVQAQSRDLSWGTICILFVGDSLTGLSLVRYASLAEQ